MRLALRDSAAAAREEAHGPGALDRRRDRGSRGRSRARKAIFTAAAGESNQLRVAQAGNTLTFTDDGAAGEGDGVAFDVEVLLGGEAGDDLTAAVGGGEIRAGGGADRLSGGPGPDLLDGGAGADDCEVVQAPLRAGTGTSPLEQLAGGEQSPPRESPDTETLEGLAEVPAAVGETFGAATAGGSVLVKRPGDKRYERLIDPASLPVGSLVDARRGTVAVLAARDTTGATQTASFFGAVFKLRQRRQAAPVTELVLRGGDFTRCSSRGRARAAGARTVRKLWGAARGASGPAAGTAPRPFAAPSG
jgi:hypothetical protein